MSETKPPKWAIKCKNGYYSRGQLSRDKLRDEAKDLDFECSPCAPHVVVPYVAPKKVKR